MLKQDLVATVSALTLSIRVIGGGVGYTVYYNIFISKFLTNVEYYVGGVMMEVLHITDLEIITEAIKLTSASEIKALMNLPELLEIRVRMMQSSSPVKRPLQKVTSTCTMRV